MDVFDQFNKIFEKYYKQADDEGIKDFSYIGMEPSKVAALIEKFEYLKGYW